jgi:hypothetical protein
LFCGEFRFWAFASQLCTFGKRQAAAVKRREGDLSERLVRQEPRLAVAQFRLSVSKSVGCELLRLRSDFAAFRSAVFSAHGRSPDVGPLRGGEISVCTEQQEAELCALYSALSRLQAEIRPAIGRLPPPSSRPPVSVPMSIRPAMRLDSRIITTVPTVILSGPIDLGVAKLGGPKPPKHAKCLVLASPSIQRKQVLIDLLECRAAAQVDITATTTVNVKSLFEYESRQCQAI